MENITLISAIIYIELVLITFAIWAIFRVDKAGNKLSKKIKDIQFQIDCNVNETQQIIEQFSGYFKTEHGAFIAKSEALPTEPKYIKQACKTCFGSGNVRKKYTRDTREACTDCLGAGIVNVARTAKSLQDDPEACKACGGVGVRAYSGHVSKCHLCDGFIASKMFDKSLSGAPDSVNRTWQFRNPAVILTGHDPKTAKPLTAEDIEKIPDFGNPFEGFAERFGAAASEPCPTCDGNGSIKSAIAGSITCFGCNGNGTIDANTSKI